jgi:hypothetical protein
MTPPSWRRRFAAAAVIAPPALRGGGDCVFGSLDPNRSRP